MSAATAARDASWGTAVGAFAVPERRALRRTAVLLLNEIAAKMTPVSQASHSHATGPPVDLRGALALTFLTRVCSPKPDPPRAQLFVAARWPSGDWLRVCQ